MGIHAYIVIDKGTQSDMFGDHYTKCYTECLFFPVD